LIGLIDVSILVNKYNRYNSNSIELDKIYNYLNKYGYRYCLIKNNDVYLVNKWYSYHVIIDYLNVIKK